MKEGKAADMVYGQEMRNKLSDSARKWADENLVGGSKAADKHLKNLKSFIPLSLREYLHQFQFQLVSSP